MFKKNKPKNYKHSSHPSSKNRLGQQREVVAENHSQSECRTQLTLECPASVGNSYDVTSVPKAQGMSQRRGEKIVSTKGPGNLLRDCVSLKCHGGFTYHTSKNMAAHDQSKASLRRQADREAGNLPGASPRNKELQAARRFWEQK